MMMAAQMTAGTVFAAAVAFVGALALDRLVRGFEFCRVFTEGCASF